MISVWIKNLRVAGRTRSEIVLSVAAPLVLLALASWIFTPTGRDLPVALVAAEPEAPAVVRFEAALTSRDGEPLYLRVETRDPVQAERMLRSGEVVAIVTLPAGFDQALARGEVVVDVVTYNAMADLEKNIRLSLLRGVERFNATQAGAPQLDGGVVDPRPVVLTRPGWFAGSLVGYALVFVGLLWGGVGSAREDEDRTIRVLQAAPTSTWQVLAGTVLSAATAALGSAALVAGVGVATTDLRLRGNPAVLVAVGLATALLAASTGVLFGALARRYYLVLPLAGLVAVVSWFVGGGFSDLTLAQGTLLYSVAQALPTTYAFRSGLAAVQGGGWAQTWSDLAVVSASALAATVLAWVAVRRRVG